MIHTRKHVATLRFGSCQFLLRDARLNLQQCHISVSSNHPGLVYTVVRESQGRCRIQARGSQRSGNATVEFTVTIDDSRAPTKAPAKPCNCGKKRV